MRKLPIGLLLAGFVLGLPARRVHAEWIPPSLPIGSQYQLIFVTEGVRDATSADIADYNAFVTAEAALNPDLPATTWHAVASTASVAAAGNAPQLAFVYNTQGILVADFEDDLYNNQGILNPVLYDQHGNELENLVWTGSDRHGLPMLPLGAGVNATAGFSFASGVLGIEGGPGPTVTELPLYALSEVITVVPEPGTVTLMVLGLLPIAFLGRRRRKR
jgi:hypothetical protein